MWRCRIINNIASRSIAHTFGLLPGVQSPASTPQNPATEPGRSKGRDAHIKT